MSRIMALVVRPEGKVTRRRVDVSTHRAVSRELDGCGSFLTVEGATGGHTWFAFAPADGLSRGYEPNDRATRVAYADRRWGYKPLAGTVLFVGYDPSNGAEFDIPTDTAAALVGALAAAELADVTATTPTTPEETSP